jgi:CheY-like chemotaxis protein
VLFPSSDENRAATGGEPVGQVQKSEIGAIAGTILVVDDEEAVRDVCMEFVQRLGFHTLGAANGEDALMLVEEHTDEILCVLLDLTMPRMDGISAFRELKRLRPDIPVLLCSGYDEQEATHHFVGEGLSGFIQKPFGLQDLRGKIESVLRRRTKSGWQEESIGRRPR